MIIRNRYTALLSIPVACAVMLVGCSAGDQAVEATKDAGEFVKKTNEDLGSAAKDTSESAEKAVEDVAGRLKTVGSDKKLPPESPESPAIPAPSTP